MKATPEEAAVLYRLAAQDRLAFERLAADPDISVRICCFHSQQAVEKALKAVAVLHGIVFPPTHDLVKLAALLAPVSLDPPVPVEMLRRLNPYAVAFRYDDREIHGISREDAKQTLDALFGWADNDFTDQIS